jgi:hypothetical protein
MATPIKTLKKILSFQGTIGLRLVHGGTVPNQASHVFNLLLLEQKT